MCVPWLIYMCDMQLPCSALSWITVSSLTHMCVTCLIHMCDMTHWAWSRCPCFHMWTWFLMGWLRLVGSFKLQVSFAEYRLFGWVLLQKRPMILRSLLVVATPYQVLAWLIHTNHMTHSYVCHDSFIGVTYIGLVRPFFIIFSFITSLLPNQICVARRNQCVPWPIYMCDMTKRMTKCDTHMGKRRHSDPTQCWTR